MIILMNICKATYHGFSGRILSKIISVKRAVDRRKNREFLIIRNVVHRSCRCPQQVSHVGWRCINRAGKLAASKQFIKSFLCQPQATSFTAELGVQFLNNNEIYCTLFAENLSGCQKLLNLSNRTAKNCVCVRPNYFTTVQRVCMSSSGSFGITQ